MVEDLDEAGRARALASRCGAFGRRRTPTFQPGHDRAAEGESGADRLAFEDVPDPDDVAAARRSLSPEQRLVAGVLGRAISDLSITGGPDARAAATAPDWIWGEDLGGAGWSFVAACEFVGLDPATVRRLAAEADGLRVRREHVYSAASTSPRPTPPRAVHPEDLDQVDDVEAA